MEAIQVQWVNQSSERPHLLIRKEFGEEDDQTAITLELSFEQAVTLAKVIAIKYKVSKK